MIESLLSIWRRHVGAKGLDNWWQYPHAPGAHERMKAEARQYAQNLLREERPDLWPIFARGDVENLCDLWLELYAGEYDGKLPGDTNRTHPAMWADGAAAEYVKEYNRPHDDCNHTRGVGVVALQYFAEYVTAALERYGVEWGQKERSEHDEQRETKPGGIALPLELDTDRAREKFAEAIARRWMAEKGNGYEWRGVTDKGKKAQLAYFCGRVYGYKWGYTNTTSGGNVGKRVPWQALQALFSFHGDLHKSLRQVYDAKPQPWRRIIDSIF